MHELSVTKNVVSIVMKHAEACHAEKVMSVELEVGELRDIVEEFLQKCFSYLCRGTIAQDAKLLVKVIPFTCQCDDCSQVFPVNIHSDISDMACPYCKGRSLSPYTGQEFIIRNIQVI